MKEVLVEKDVLLGFDKFGKEIYYNSKVMFNNSIGTFKYSYDELCFKIVWEDGYSRSLNSNFLKLTELVND